MKQMIVAAFCCVLGSCASGKLKQRAAEIDRLKLQNNGLAGDVKKRDEKIAMLEGAKRDLEGKTHELGDKLKASQTQIDSLTQSNKDLSGSMEANKSELALKVKELVAAKDELSRKLAEAQKESAVLKADKGKLFKENIALREQNKMLQGELAPLKAQREKEEMLRQELEAKLSDQKEALSLACQKEIKSGQAKIENHGANLALILQETLLFESQEAKFMKNAAPLLARVGKALREGGGSVRIEAHVDNAPLKRELFGGFSSHWELTAARAVTVARYLQESAGMDSRLITPVGYGESRPIAGNDRPAGQAENRRIVFTIEP